MCDIGPCDDHWCLSACLPVEPPNRYSVLSKSKTSKYRGVCWDKNQGRWKVRISTGYKGGARYLGYHIDEIEAARMYDRAAKEMGWADYQLNLPPPSASSSSVSLSSLSASSSTSLSEAMKLSSSLSK